MSVCNIEKYTIKFFFKNLDSGLVEKILDFVKDNDQIIASSGHSAIYSDKFIIGIDSDFRYWIGFSDKGLAVAFKLVFHDNVILQDMENS